MISLRLVHGTSNSHPQGPRSFLGSACSSFGISASPMAVTFPCVSTLHQLLVPALRGRIPIRLLATQHQIGQRRTICRKCGKMFDDESREWPELRWTKKTPISPSARHSSYCRRAVVLRHFYAHDCSSECCKRLGSIIGVVCLPIPGFAVVPDMSRSYTSLESQV